MRRALTYLALAGLLEDQSTRKLFESQDHPAIDIKHSMKLPTDHLPHEVGEVAHSINGSGGKAMLVGGAVRDMLRKHFGHSNKDPKDWDMEVHGMQPEHLHNHLNTLGKNKRVGEKSFGINKMTKGKHEFDISIPSHASFKQGEPGHVDPHMTVSEAGRRRDFTMNTVSMDPTNRRVYDPQGGIHDIKHKILRHSSDHSFHEANGNGPIRIMRGAQFAARQGLTAHPDTLKLMQKSAHRLNSKEVAPERVHGEWKKLITKGVHPSHGLSVLKQSGALKHIHPELHSTSDEDWDHLKRSMDHAHAATHDHPHKESIRYATLLHKTGAKGSDLRQRFGLKKDIAERTKSLVDHAHKVRELHQNRDNVSGSHIRHLAHSLGSANIDQLVHVAHAMHKAGSDDPHHAGEWLRAKAREHGVHDGPVKPLLTGKHLKQIGVKPGPHYSKIINHVHKLQLDGHVRTEEDAVRHARKFVGQQTEDTSFYARVFLS